MKKVLKFIGLLGVAFFMNTGCASTSKAGSDKTAAAKEFTIPEGKGVVYLYRNGRAVGAAGSTQIKVNGQNAGGTGPNSFFRWELKPGKYVFTAATAESSAAVELDVASGIEYIIMQSDHLGVSSGRVSMKEMELDKGKRAIKNCKLLISSYIPEG